MALNTTPRMRPEPVCIGMLRADFQHSRAERAQLVAREDAPSEPEHVSLFLLNVVLDVFFEHLELRTPRLVVCRNIVELLDDEIRDMMLLEPLEHDLARLRVRLQ